MISSDSRGNAFPPQGVQEATSSLLIQWDTISEIGVEKSMNTLLLDLQNRETKFLTRANIVCYR